MNVEHEWTQMYLPLNAEHEWTPMSYKNSGPLVETNVDLSLGQVTKMLIFKTHTREFEYSLCISTLRFIFIYHKINGV